MAGVEVSYIALAVLLAGLVASVRSVTYSECRAQCQRNPHCRYASHLNGECREELAELKGQFKRVEVVERVYQLILYNKKYYVQKFICRPVLLIFVLIFVSVNMSVLFLQLLLLLLPLLFLLLFFSSSFSSK